MNNKLNYGLRISLILFLTLVIMPFVASYSLEITPNTNVTVAENNTLVLTLTTNLSGSNTFFENTGKGSISHTTSNEAEFSWTPSFGDAGTNNTSYLLEFEVTNSTNNLNKNLSVRVTKTNNPFTITTTGGGSTHEKTNVFEIETSRTQVSCKYDLEEKPYSELSFTAAAQNTNKTKFRATINFEEDGDFDVYIKCEDSLNNFATSSINYDVLLKPVAVIKLQPPGPVREGLIEIVLTTDLPLLAPPTLTYRFNSETAENDITLIGSSKTWKGYMVIPESDIQRIGTFSFKGTSTNNMEGTHIKEGKIFIVDTNAPSEVSSVSVVQDSDRLKLSWYYLNEESDNIVDYRIYRKVGNGGVDYTNYYKTTSNKEFFDSDIEINQAYYYKVSAVKESGTEGPLSREVFITYIPEVQPTTNQTLSSTLKFELNLKDEIIERILFDVESVERQLERELGEKGEVIRTLGLLDVLRSKKADITSLRNELKALENRDLTKNEFDQLTTKIVDDSLAFFLEVPTSVEIIDSSNYQEFTDDDKTISILNKYLDFEGVDKASSRTQNHVTSTANLQDSLLIDVTTTLVRVLYPETQKNIGLVKKTISSDTPLTDVVIVEETDTSLTSDLQSITFSNRPVIKDDLLTWKLSSLERFSLSYYFETEASFDQLRNTKTIVVEEEVVTQTNNLITGKATDVPNSEDSNLLIPTILSLIILSILTGYYLYINNSNIEITDYLRKGVDKLRYKLKRKNNTIMPKGDDSHRVLNLTPDPVKPAIHEVNEIKEQPVNVTENKESVAKSTEDFELKEVKSKLDDYKNKLENTNDILPHEIKDLYKDINEIKKLCETIHNKSIYDYAQKTKKELEKTINQITSQTKNKTAKKTIKKSTKKVKKYVKASKGKEFVTVSGDKFSSLKELKDSLKDMSDDVFNHHINSKGNDFANWTEHVFKDKELADKIRKQKKKNSLIKLL